MTSFGTHSSTTLWVRRLALAGLLLCFVVVVLGAYVRLTAAGLGCPDWPGLLRASHAHRRRAERRCAGGVSEHAAARRQGVARDDPSLRRLDARSHHRRHHGDRDHRAPRDACVSIPLAVLLLITVVVQGVLGMLTVTWQLKPLIVTLHLIFGLTTLSLLWWLWLSLRGSGRGGIRFGGGKSHGASAYPSHASPARTAGAGRAHRARHADRARRLDQQQLRRRGMPGFPEVPAAAGGPRRTTGTRSSSGAGSA